MALMKTKILLNVVTSFVGYHCWPEAPAEVAFLRNSHRHVFNVLAQLPVTGFDRELEFFLVRREIDRCCAAMPVAQLLGGVSAPRSSCEEIAREIGLFLLEKHHRLPYVAVTVQEDAENGASVHLEPQPGTGE